MKLTARGRTVLAEVSRTTDLPLEVGQSTPRKVKTTLALLSDGRIAIKHTWLKPDGRVDHSDAWHEYTRLTGKHRTPRVTEETVTRWTERYAEQGYAAQLR